MKSKHTDRMVNDLSLRYNLPKGVIRAIILSQFEFLRDVIRSGEKDNFDSFASVRLMRFGVFKVMKKRFYTIKNARDNYEKFRKDMERRKLEREKRKENESVSD